MAALIFIVIISVLVIVHELGHFLFAKKNKIKVIEFGLGYPPRMLKLFKWKGTIFSLNWIPFGGFVQMEGEDGPESGLDKTVEKVKTAFNKDEDAPFYVRSKKARLETVLGGVLFNFIFAILAFALIFSKTGIPKSLDGQLRIYEVAENSPAAEAGIMAETNVLSLRTVDDWVEMNSVTEIQEFVAVHRGETIGIRTTGQCFEDSCQEILLEKEIYLRTIEETPEGEGSMGISFTDNYLKKYPWYLAPIEGIFYGFREALMMGVMILQVLGTTILDLMNGKAANLDVAGPVGIVHQANNYGFFEGGILNIISFSALLSINLGVMNLLPFPALDGGRAVFIILEKFFKREKVDKVAKYANYVGFLILIALMLLVSANDIRKIFQGV